MQRQVAKEGLTYINERRIMELGLRSGRRWRNGMARLTDPTILAKFRRAFSQWRFTGYVTWKPIARQWVEQNLEAGRRGRSPRSCAASLIVAVKLTERPTRSEWRQWQFHYDFRIEIGGRLLYMKALLIKGAVPKRSQLFTR